MLVSNTRFVWGLDAPVATFAGQIHKESSWNPDARSPYATGLAQFTPATAADISKRYPDLTSNAPFEPQWAIRALARYDLELFTRQKDAKTVCDRWGFTLSSYNGGMDWVDRDKRYTKSLNDDPTRWFGHVEKHSRRSQAAFQENRDYPRQILLVLQQIYAPWGPIVPCQIDQLL